MDFEEGESSDENDKSHEPESAPMRTTPQEIIAINITSPVTARMFESMPVFSASDLLTMPAIVPYICYLSI